MGGVKNSNILLSYFLISYNENIQFPGQLILKAFLIHVNIPEIYYAIYIPSKRSVEKRANNDIKWLRLITLRRILMHT